ncbi:MAG: phosphate regulon sensor histidine kinase PhoR [Hahellaceae bacterium]|nr:phosphate regulon sensor histidine kinase PhoR [Hahellaceae bacterium]MCP5170528.1 phosphate regulon sensor histidine kinase PhoR [Hahellaceae bacterium]
MNKEWSAHLSTVIAGIILLFILGLVLGEVAWVMLAGNLIYLGWTLRQTFRLHQWLNHSDESLDTPESYGLWGDLFDNIHKLQKHHKDAQRKLQTMLNRVQESTNALNDAVVITDANGAMDWWNQAAERMLGFKTHIDHGQLIYNLLRDPVFKTYFDSKSYKSPLELASPARPHIILRFHITLFGEDDRLIIAQDISRIHQLERMRKDFVSNVSHEMRTPLTVISGYLETLQDHSDELPRKWQRAVSTMRQQAHRMERLITDLLLLAKLETTDHKPQDKASTLKILLDDIRRDAQEFSADKQHNIRLIGQGDDALMGDEPQLRSALSNIIFNAVKYTPANGDIDIHWWSDSKGVHIAVRDNGIGIDPVHLPRLTERFYRADPSRHKETGGSGLGLAIVKHVMLNHGGTLEVHSEPNIGSEFICHFPLKRLVPEAPRAKEA